MESGDYLSGLTQSGKRAISPLIGRRVQSGTTEHLPKGYQWENADLPLPFLLDPQSIYCSHPLPAGLCALNARLVALQ